MTATALSTDPTIAAIAISEIMQMAMKPGTNLAAKTTAHRMILEIAAAHGIATADPRDLRQDGQAAIELLKARSINPN